MAIIFSVQLGESGVEVLRPIESGSMSVAECSCSILSEVRVLAVAQEAVALFGSRLPHANDKEMARKVRFEAALPFHWCRRGCVGQWVAPHRVQIELGGFQRDVKRSMLPMLGRARETQNPIW